MKHYLAFLLGLALLLTGCTAKPAENSPSSSVTSTDEVTSAMAQNSTTSLQQAVSADASSQTVSKTEYSSVSSVANSSQAPAIPTMTKEQITYLENKQNAMKQSVLNAKSEYSVEQGGKIYYFSAQGNDQNDGLSAERPLKTLEQLAKLPLKSGDVVLFKRGELFRGNIQAVEGVTYSAYDNGEKPIICASKQNYANSADWQKTEYSNVWVSTHTLKNVGIVLFNHTGKLGNYNEMVGKRMVAGLNNFDGAASLREDLQVWSDIENDKLYLYSKENPATRFHSIEIGEQGHAITIGSAENVTIDNLHITLTGSHGVGASTTKNLTVRNCVFDWLGGSILLGHAGGNVTGYGNAVEIYGGIDGYHVYNNWIYQIYDTGITHQFGSDNKTNTMNNIKYHDNLIEYCFWSIEYYNGNGGATTARETKNVHIYDNYCRKGGYGWGCTGREISAQMYCINFQADKTENYVTEHNIFEDCLGYLISTCTRPLKKGYTFKENIYVQPYGTLLAQLETGDLRCDESTAGMLDWNIGESNPKVWYAPQR